MDPTLESEQSESAVQAAEPVEPMDVSSDDVEQPKAAKLRVHRLFVDLPGAIRFVCDACNYLSFKRVHFTSHYEHNHGARLLVNFRCRGCGDYFNDSRSCGVHIRRCEQAAALENEREESIARNSSRQKARPRKYSPSPEVERAADAPTTAAAVPSVAVTASATVAMDTSTEIAPVNGGTSQRQVQKRHLTISAPKVATENAPPAASPVPNIIIKTEEETLLHDSNSEEPPTPEEKDPLPPPAKVPRTPSSSSASESTDSKKSASSTPKEEPAKKPSKPVDVPASRKAKSKTVDKEVIIAVPRDSDIFKCPYCPKTYQRKDRIVDHADKDHDRVVVFHFRCSYCSDIYEDSRLCFFHSRTCHKKQPKQQKEAKPQPKRKEPERKPTPPKAPAPVKNIPRLPARPRHQPIGHLNNSDFGNRNSILNGGAQYSHDNLFYQELGRYISKNPGDAQILLKAADQFAVVTREVIRKLGFTAFGRKAHDRPE